MILLVDSGNTRAKWRLVSASGALFAEGADLESLPDNLNHLPAGTALTRAAVSVVGSDQAVESIRQQLRELICAPVHFHWAETAFKELRNSYQDVTRMGADRWHAMVAAWSDFSEAVAVVDTGSAVTVDYVDSRGQHLGGYILPGLAMMRQGLETKTARVFFDPKHDVDTRPANNTSDAVNHGFDWLISSLIQRLEKDCARYGINHVVLTGGDAERWQALGLDASYRPGLVLDGLWWADKEKERLS